MVRALSTGGRGRGRGPGSKPGATWIVFAIKPRARGFASKNMRWRIPFWVAPALPVLGGAQKINSRLDATIVCNSMRMQQFLPNAEPSEEAKQYNPMTTGAIMA